MVIAALTRTNGHEYHALLDCIAPSGRYRGVVVTDSEMEKRRIECKRCWADEGYVVAKEMP